MEIDSGQICLIRSHTHTHYIIYELADQGDAKAQYDLGLLKAKNQGVEKDEKEAVKWYRKAAEQGDEDAKVALKELSQ